MYRLQRNLAIDTQNIKVTKVVVKKKKKSGVSPVFIPLLPLAALHCCAAAVKFLLSPTIQIRFVELGVSP